MQECDRETDHWLEAGVGSWRLGIVGKMEMLWMQYTHCLTQVLMRLCGERVPQAGRNRRLVKDLIEDGVIVVEQEVIVTEVDLSVLDWTVETESGEEEEIEELMNESCSWLDSEEESSESEEEEMVWEGFIEV